MFLWAGLQEDAYIKWKRGERQTDEITLDEVKSWLPDDRDEATMLMVDIFGAYTKAQPPNA